MEGTIGAMTSQTMPSEVTVVTIRKVSNGFISAAHHRPPKIANTLAQALEFIKKDFE